MVRVTGYRAEPSENGPGLLNYLWDQQCELLVNDLIPTFQRNKVVDFTLPWAYDHIKFLIPVTDESANINAVVKPFQWPIWLGVGISIVCVIAVLDLIQRYLESASGTGFEPNNKPQTGGLTNDGQLRGTKTKTEKPYLYVVGNLVSQGFSILQVLLSE
ncbi:uncharacterized protein LOC124326572 isoform X2 [Daphnia pulicaria]|uniref:uncharacterized protein LOC124326572 isoform X2 n=1 Tax=Daphnia pulicaria TaxID=35523 RepID=UPI001EEB9CF0|nr:uncharacterized protein LOC124326572 isoform X2 [Daphnia pulicaria]